MITKEVEIMWEGKPAKVVLKKLTWGELNEVLRASLSKVRFGGVMSESGILEMDLITFREMLIFKSIVSAPFQKSIDAIRALEGDEGEKLFAVATSLNPFFRLVGGGENPAEGGEDTAGNG